MKNLKKITALILCAALCGCSAVPTETEASTSATTASAAAEETTTTTAATTTTASAAETETEKTTADLTLAPSQTLAASSPKEISNISKYVEENRSFYSLFFHNSNENLLNGNHGDEKKFTENEDGTFTSEEPAIDRYFSHKGLLYSGEDIALVDNAVVTVDMDDNFPMSEALTLYQEWQWLDSGVTHGFAISPLTIDILSIVKEYKDTNAYLKDGWYTVYSENEITVNAFIRMNGENAELIVDPAYSYYLPNAEQWTDENGNEGLFRYDINGVEAIMSTPAASAELADGVLPELSGSYIYVKAVLDSYNMEYHLDASKTRYYCTVKSAEIIEPDAAKAMKTVYLDMESADKPSEMAQMFSELLRIRDKWYSKDIEICSLRPIDLDFDDVPELFLTCGYDNTEVYRLKNGTLEPVGSFKPYLIRSDELGNKMICDAENKRWLLSYYNDDSDSCTGYMRLTDNGLEFEEILCGGYKDGRTFCHYKGKDFDESADIYAESKALLDEKRYNVINIMQAAEALYIERYDGYPYYSVVHRYDSSLFYCSDSFTYTFLVPATERMLEYEAARIVDNGFLGEYSYTIHGKEQFFNGAYAKPVIYLYPEEDTDVSVSVDFVNGGEITCSYPEYNGCWSVTAMPDGTLYDESGNEYYCLYWEGRDRTVYDNSNGWCVAGGDTAKFLREKLLEIGLTAREANEFIIYWLPIMQKNPYNIITFHTEDYAAAVPLDVSPAPDSVIRVFMTFEASNEAAGIQPQELPHYERNGFTLVEWGGAEIS